MLMLEAALPEPVGPRYWATSYAEGDKTWHHFLAKAIEAETARW